MRGVPGTRDISYDNTRHKYTVQKMINYKTIKAGSYPTLIIALMKRDEYNAHGWDKNYIREDKQKQQRKKNHKPYKQLKPSLPRHITYNQKTNLFIINKTINNHTIHYGSYKTLKEALQGKQYWEKHNWNPIHKHRKQGPLLPRYINYKEESKLFVIQRQENNKTVRYGSFKTLKEAVHERNLLIQYNWDFEVLCDLDIY